MGDLDEAADGAVTGILLYSPMELFTSPADGVKNSSDGRCTVGGAARKLGGA